MHTLEKILRLAIMLPMVPQTHAVQLVLVGCGVVVSHGAEGPA